MCDAYIIGIGLAKFCRHPEPRLPRAIDRLICLLQLPRGE